MQLSCAAELAVRGAIVLAGEYGKGPVTLNAICQRRDLPKQYLVKIFASLGKADLVESTRGKRGGYALARPPGQISVLEIIEAVEGPVVLNLCQYTPPKCDNVDCPLRPIWARLQRIIRTELAGVSLADCIRIGNDKSP